VGFWVALCVQRGAAVDVIAEVVLTDDLFIFFLIGETVKVDGREDLRKFWCLM